MTHTRGDPISEDLHALEAWADALLAKLEVGFFDWMARVARVHKFGQQERIGKKGAIYKYAEQPLLRLSEPGRTLIRESLLPHMRND